MGSKCVSAGNYMMGYVDRQNATDMARRDIIAWIACIVCGYATVMTIWATSRPIVLFS